MAAVVTTSPARTPSPTVIAVGIAQTSFRVASRGESPIYRRARTPPRSHSDADHPLSASAHIPRSVSAQLMSIEEAALCPICQQQILPTDDVVALGCADRRHEIHCQPCQSLWLRSTDAVRGVVCPLCRSDRPQMRSMTPGGSYTLDGGVAIMSWPRLQSIAPTTMDTSE